ncbi:MAG: hypothetical protein GY768_28040 [Planctomycetaceae bacterium]|nr:hypothetical protein [Planctomycetaceae bacterium]
MGVFAGVKDQFDQLCGVGADFCRPVDEALRTPLGPLLVRLGHMFFDSGVTSLEVASDMTGHRLAFIEALNGGVGNAYIDLFADQWISAANF